MKKEEFNPVIFEEVYEQMLERYAEQPCPTKPRPKTSAQKAADNAGQLQSKAPQPPAPVNRLPNKPKPKKRKCPTQGALQFSEDVFDFTRCQRSDGTFYGTSGVCRSGVQVGAREMNALKKAAAGGNKRAAVALAVVEGKKTREEAKAELAGGGAETAKTAKKAKAKPAKAKKEAPKPEEPAKEKKQEAKKESFDIKKASDEELKAKTNELTDRIYALNDKARELDIAGDKEGAANARREGDSVFDQRSAIAKEQRSREASASQPQAQAKTAEATKAPDQTSKSSVDRKQVEQNIKAEEEFYNKQLKTAEDNIEALTKKYGGDTDYPEVESAIDRKYEVKAALKKLQEDRQALLNKDTSDSVADEIAARHDTSSSYFKILGAGQDSEGLAVHQGATDILGESGVANTPRGLEFARKMGGDRQANESLDSLIRFTQNNYGDIRSAAYGTGGSSRDKQDAENINKALAAMPHPDINKYRGMGVDNKTLAQFQSLANSNGTFTDLGPSSWSTNGDVANSYSAGSTSRPNRVLFETRNKKGASVEGFGQTGEFEILTPGNTNFKYTGYRVERQNGQDVHVFTVEES